MKKSGLMLLAALCLPLILAADVFTYDAKVISANPTTVSRQVDSLPTMCRQSKPDSLDQILAWDITCSQPQFSIETVYNVDYEIEGQRFTTTVASLPGDTLPVRIQLR